jgi:hypothetical protein
MIFFYDFFPHGSTLRAYQTVHKRTKANLIHINRSVDHEKALCISLGLSVRVPQAGDKLNKKID